jgi:hypothetical protein
MATCLTVIADALRLGRVIGMGREPRAAEAEAGLRCLQSLYDMWIANGMFGRLEDTWLDTDGTAEEGKRYFVTSGVTLTGLGDEYAPDGDEARQPRDLAIFEVNETDGDRFVQIYDRDGWVEMTQLTLDSIAPLSNRGGMGLSACLATSGAFLAMFGSGQGISTDIYQLANQFQQALAMKRGTTRDAAGADYY